MSASFVSFVPPRAKTDKPAAPADLFRAVIAPTLPPIIAVPEPAVVPAPVVSLAAAPTPAPKPTCTRSITLKREQDRITWIVVQCSCGEVTEIDCQYGAEG